MRIRSFPGAALLLCAGALLPASCFAQSDLPKFGLGAKMSTLGIGVEGATAISHRNNVRVGVNLFNFGYDFDKDGVDYNATLKLRSAQILLDQYIAGGLHVSPGFMFFNSNKLSATASVPNSGTFTLGDRTYRSDAVNPAHGTANLEMGKAAPMVLLGVGNLLPRNGRHFTANFEVGVVFRQAPRMTINLSGRGCDTVTNICGELMSIPGLPANIQSEQSKVNEDLKPLRFYPVVSMGFGYSF